MPSNVLRASIGSCCRRAIGRVYSCTRALVLSACAFVRATLGISYLSASWSTLNLKHAICHYMTFLEVEMYENLFTVVSCDEFRFSSSNFFASNSFCLFFSSSHFLNASSFSWRRCSSSSCRFRRASGL